MGIIRYESKNSNKKPKWVMLYRCVMTSKEYIDKDDELCLWHSGKGFVGEATEGNGDPNVTGQGNGIPIWAITMNKPKLVEGLISCALYIPFITILTAKSLQLSSKFLARFKSSMYF